jgi:Fic family protein
MNFHPRFRYTESMLRNFGVIEAARAVVDFLPLPPDRVLRMRQAARERSTRSSTRIEGNTLEGAEIGRAVVAPGKAPSVMQQEVRNYWRALEWIEEQIEANRPESEEFIRELHAIIIVKGQGRRGQRSDYRKDECPVVDTATGSIDYGPPRPADVPELMNGLVAWWRDPATAKLLGPVRAGLLAHRFVSIHPFGDGNGRTARALATTELWRSGYEMRGFLSIEEYYAADLQAYYSSLQMGLPVSYYDGRHDPDHTRWLEYFFATMAKAAEGLREQAVTLYAPKDHENPPWEGLRRVQQQILTRLVMRGVRKKADTTVFTPGDVVDWFGVSANTARDWLEKWMEEGFIHPERAGVQRIRSYVLAPHWADILKSALINAPVKTT